MLKSSNMLFVLSALTAWIVPWSVPAGVPVGQGVEYDSVADWAEDGVQPDGAWTYGSYGHAGEWEAFEPLLGFASFSSWIGGTGSRWGVGPSIGQFAQVPSSAEWAVRRWTSPVEGTLEIDYDAMRLDDEVGDDGQVAGIYRNGTLLWSQDLGSDTDGRQVSGTLSTAVEVGDVVDFIVDAKGDALADWTHFWARIRTKQRRPSPPVGLAAHWPLDGVSDLPVGLGHSRLARAPDRSGNQNHSLLQFMSSDDWISGRMGNMLDFDGGNDHTVTAHTDLGDGATELTQSVWISPDSQGGWRGILTTKNANDGSQYFGLNSTGYGVNAIEFRSLNARVQSLDYSIPFTSWTHVVGVWKSGQVFKLYLNGVEAALDPGNSAASPPSGSVDVDAWYIGADRLIGGRYFNGRIDDVSLWTRALNAAEILELYRLGINGWDASYLGNPPEGYGVDPLPYARGLKVWLDAQDMDGRGNHSLADGDEVLQWFNKAGGLAGHANAGSGALQAGVFRAGMGPKGTDVLQLGGDGLDGLQLDEFMSTSTFSIFALARVTGGQGQIPLFWDYGDSVNRAVVFGTSRGGAWVQDGNGDRITAAWTGQLFDRQWETGLMILREHAGAFTLESGPALAPVTATNPLYDATSWDGGHGTPHLGKIADATHDEILEGEIAEVLIYDHALTAADREAVLEYLDRKYFTHAGGTMIRIR